MSINWVIMQGQAGAIRRAQLRDDAGAVNLSLFDSVTMTIAKTKTSTPVILNAACTPDADQTTEVKDAYGNSISGKGWLSFTFNSTTAGIAMNDEGYLGSFKCMDGSTPHYFPLKINGERTYFRLVVHKPLV
jgi:hypothetical protein